MTARRMCMDSEKLIFRVMIPGQAFSGLQYYNQGSSPTPSRGVTCKAVSDVKQIQHVREGKGKGEVPLKREGNPCSETYLLLLLTMIAFLFCHEATSSSSGNLFQFPLIHCLSAAMCPRLCTRNLSGSNMSVHALLHPQL